MTEIIDGRPKLVIDTKKLALWEMEMLEGNTTNALFMLCRYLEANGTKVSPDLPDTPTDELSKKELVIMKNSEAYKRLRRFDTVELEAAMRAIKAETGF